MYIHMLPVSKMQTYHKPSTVESLGYGFTVNSYSYLRSRQQLQSDSWSLCCFSDKSPTWSLTFGGWLPLGRVVVVLYYFNIF